MVNKPDKNEARLRRHRRVRGKISGTAERPRLDVFRSSKHIYAQIIDDVAGVKMCIRDSLRYARISPRKVSVVLDLIRNQPLDKALAILQYLSLIHI